MALLLVRDGDTDADDIISSSGFNFFVLERMLLLLLSTPHYLPTTYPYYSIAIASSHFPRHNNWSSRAATFRSLPLPNKTIRLSPHPKDIRQLCRNFYNDMYNLAILNVGTIRTKNCLLSSRELVGSIWNNFQAPISKIFFSCVLRNREVRNTRETEKLMSPAARAPPAARRPHINHHNRSI